ncbi:MAG: DNA replication/repair protein RecF [Clostridiales bacterium]|nr:DNA replication/repair protein RecF [Clostridiales bacterium]
MHLVELSLNNFRNFKRLDLPLTPNITILVGKNAQGKTNILESIVYTCTGRSHRTSLDREVIRFGEDFAYIRAIVEKSIGNNKVEIGLSKSKSKMVNINGTSVKRLGELMGHINGVVFSPDDLSLIKGAPSERRKFLDMEISQIRPNYFYALQKYNRVLSQRNNLLKDIQKRPSMKKGLGVWSEQLSDAGAQIIWERNRFLRKLRIVSAKVHKTLTFGNEKLDIIYRPSIEQKGDIEETKKHFLEVLDSTEAMDIERGITQRGCHRDDMLFSIDNIDTRTYGSQGQQRTVVLSLKLAEIEIMKNMTGEMPILLLDDVFSELDEYRKKMLLDSIGDVQAIITTTNIDDVSALDEKSYLVYRVESGNVWRQG